MRLSKRRKIGPGGSTVSKSRLIVRHRPLMDQEIAAQVITTVMIINVCLFIVLEALSREFKEGLPIELMYADVLVLLADSVEELIEKLMRWRAGMEGKGLRVNLGKTK